jgi:hypothetical protein
MVNMLHLITNNSCNNDEKGQDEALKLWVLTIVATMMKKVRMKP